MGRSHTRGRPIARFSHQEVLKMIAYLLLALAGPHQGGAPTNWQPLAGGPAVRYRWSRPTSNSCLVEFASDDRGEQLSFEAIANVIINRPSPPVIHESLSPLKSDPPIIVPQTSERVVSIELGRMGRDVRNIHDCYGVEAVRGQETKGTDTAPEARPKPRGK
jgi:hypothetical protein